MHRLGKGRSGRGEWKKASPGGELPLHSFISSPFQASHFGMEKRPTADQSFTSTVNSEFS